MDLIRSDSNATLLLEALVQAAGTTAPTARLDQI